jgi:hypothetical protein
MENPRSNMVDKHRRVPRCCTAQQVESFAINENE